MTHEESFTALPKHCIKDPPERLDHAHSSLEDSSWVELINSFFKKIMTVALINVFIDNSIHVCNTLGSHPSPHISFSFLPYPSPTLISVSSLFYFVSVVFTVLNSLGLPRASWVDIHYLLETEELSNGNPMHTMTSSSPAARTAKMEPTS